jgi:hypothetical protein
MGGGRGLNMSSRRRSRLDRFLFESTWWPVGLAASLCAAAVAAWLLGLIPNSTAMVSAASAAVVFVLFGVSVGEFVGARLRIYPPPLPRGWRQEMMIPGALVLGLFIGHFFW